MKLDILRILTYIVFILSVAGYIAYVCKSKLVNQIEYVLIKNIFLNMFKYYEIIIQRQYFSYFKYNIWRFCSLF